jgi:hypothetical protein
MSCDLHNSRYKLNRLHNPWEKFTHRDVKRHNAENEIAFRLTCPPLATLGAPLTILPFRTTGEVIDSFLNYRSQRLYDCVPRRRQLLKDFLGVVLSSLSASDHPTASATYLDDVMKYSSTSDIALIDDWNSHESCARKIGKACPDCYNYSAKISMPALCNHLRREVKYIVQSPPSPGN